MKKKKENLRDFYILWSTQGLSQLGSTMTGFALTLWLYQQTGSALQTALLSICSYAPYVLMSIFAGALSDKWDKKKTMLACDALNAVCTVAVFILLKAGLLRIWHLYLLNAVNGLLNTVQNPASNVAITMVIPKAAYQKAGSMRAFLNSLNTILHPVLATALYSLGGMDLVIAVDLTTFFVAFIALLLWIRLPSLPKTPAEEKEAILTAAKAGLQCLRENKLVLWLILFLAGVNLVASAFDAALPAFILPRENGGEGVLGIVTSFSGVAMLAGSLVAMLMPKPKNRIRVIVGTMLFSLSIENFVMSLTNEPWLWCGAQILGWLPVPIMNTNLDVVVRSSIPLTMQGRVFAWRNTLQFFTIPLGRFLGGLLTDSVFEPLVAKGGFVAALFGGTKGGGAGMMIFVLGLTGLLICLIFGKILSKYRYEE